MKYIVSFFWFENGFLQVKPSLLSLLASVTSIYVISYLHLLHNVFKDLSNISPVGKFLEIIQTFSEAATTGVP